MHHLVERLRSSGVNMVFAGFKKQVVDVMRATGLLTVIVETNFYINADRTLEAISATVTAEGIEGAFCLLPQK